MMKTVKGSALDAQSRIDPIIGQARKVAKRLERLSNDLERFAEVENEEYVELQDVKRNVEQLNASLATTLTRVSNRRINRGL